MNIHALSCHDVDALIAASHLFDDPVEPGRAVAFLERKETHCLIAYVDDEPAGFVTGVEISHPDKPTEMLLYELGVDEQFRRQGIGTALTRALASVAETGALRGMWVLTEPGDVAAISTYRSAGAQEPEEAALLEWPLAVQRR